MSQKNIQVVLLGTDAKLAETISMLVRHEDCAFSLAGNQADALRAVQSGLTDIIMLDLKSAETDSFNLLRQIKHHPPAKPIFTIGLATGSETTVLLRAFDIGLNENIQLPLENSLFRAQLRSAVHLKGQLEDLQMQQQELQRRQQELRCPTLCPKRQYLVPDHMTRRQTVFLCGQSWLEPRQE